MVWYDEKALEIEGEGVDGLNIEDFKVIRSINFPEGYSSYIFPLSVLDPINKVQEETFYQFVKESMEGHGALYNPLIIYPLHIDEWKIELEVDKFMTPPPFDQDEMRLRIQCGCNRFFAAKELGYDAIECAVVDVLKDAQDLAHVMRVDKKWQRGSNMADLVKISKRGKK